MRSWVIALCLLTLLPALSDGRGAAAGAKTEALLTAIDGDLFVIAEQPDAEPESETGEGILTPLDANAAANISPSYANFCNRDVADYYTRYEIRGPPQYS